MLATVSVSALDGVPVARVHGEVDASNARRVGQELTHAVPNDAMGLVIDLTGTEYLDSSGVHMLFELSDRLRRRQQDLRLVVGAESFVADILDAVNMGETATRSDSIAEAVAGLRP